jgi:hypothetical protein
MIAQSGLSLMNLALLDIDANDVNTTVQKITLLHSYDDQALSYRNCDGEIPLHHMINRLQRGHGRYTLK